MKYITWVYIGFIAVATIGLTTSWYRYETLIELCWWIFYGGATFFALAHIRTEKTKVIFYHTVTLFAVVLGIIGMISILLGNVSYQAIRLVSVFGTHNAFAGVLFIPLLIAVTQAVEKKSKYWYVIAAFLVCCFILTFSRGSFLSLIVALLFSFRFFKKSIIKPVGIVFISSIVLVLGFIMIVKAQAPEKDIQVYGGETYTENAFTARVQYGKDATQVWLQHPILGVGLGNYKIGLSSYKTNPLFFSADPHNLYLKLLAENGIGGLLFIGGMLYLLVFLYRRQKYSPFVVGCIAIILHNGIDVDWRYHEIPFIFFISLGVLLAEEGYTLSDTVKKIYTATTTLALFFIIYLYFFSTLNADLWYKKSEQAFLSGDTKTALEMLEQARLRAPHDQSIYAAMAEIYVQKKDWENIIRVLEKAVDANKTATLTNQYKLAVAYMNLKEYTKMKSLADTIDAVYRPYLLSEWYRGNPERELIGQNYRAIMNLGSMAKKESQK